MVCTGNTCRSPLAQVLLQSLHPDWETRSAGVMAKSGGPASRHSRAIARQRGLSLEEHRSQEVTRELIEWADDILCMSEAHRRAVLQQHPGAAGKTRALGEISDPIGQSLEAYQRCAEQIEEALEMWQSQPHQ
jgi:protein-tyrosine phosphatase